MGAKCCMPVKDDKPVILRKKYGVLNEIYTRRNNRCSPSWSFRCDNRTHIEDIVDNPTSYSGAVISEFRSAGHQEFESVSDGRSSSDSFQTPKWHKFRDEGNSQTSQADCSTVNKSSPEEKEISECPSTASNSGPKLSYSTTSADPSSSRTYSHPSDPTSSWKPHRLLGHHLSRQVFDGRILTLDSLNEEGRQSMLSFCSGDLSNGESYGGSSSDCWSMRSFSELAASSQRDGRTNTQPSPSSFSSDSQTCGLCLKLLKERASWKDSEVAAVAILVCGHVYHAECLEAVTPEAFKFDPSCPTCSHGESSTANTPVKSSLKIRNKISKRAVADIDVDGNLVLERQKNGSYILKKLKLGSRNSGKSFGQSFLRRHFSFGPRPVRLSPESEHSTKKGFWARYQSRE